MADTRFSELAEYSDGTDTTIQVPIIITDDGGTTWENYRFSLSRAMPYYLSASTGTVSIPAGRPVMARYYIQSTGSAITVSLTGETFPGGASSFTIEAGGFAEIVKTGVSAYSFVSASNGLLYNLQAKRLRASITQDSTDDGNVYAVIGQIELTAQYARWGGSIAIVSGGHANTAPSVTHVDLYARQEAAMNNDAVVSAHAWTVGAPAVEFSYTLTHTPTSSYVTLYAHRSANFVTASVTLLDYEAYLATDGWASAVWDSSSPAGIVDVPTTDIIMEYYSGTPAMDGTGSAGVSTQVARGDHVHPTDTSKADLASPAFTGTPTAPTASSGTDTTQIATTEFVQDAIAGKADLASPALTGTPTAPTASAGTDTTQIATTEFVQDAVAGAVGIAAVRGCAYWEGTVADNRSGTYVISGNVCTITQANHGHVVDNWVVVDFTSGGGVDGAYRITTIINADSYSFPLTAANTSGNCTLKYRKLRMGKNINSIAGDASSASSGNYVNLTSGVDDVYNLVWAAAGSNAATVYANTFKEYPVAGMEVFGRTKSCICLMGIGGASQYEAFLQSIITVFW